MKVPVFKYIKVYSRILKLAIASLVAYRFDIIIRSLYALVYTFGGFISLQIVFNHTTSLVGFSKIEIELMFASLCGIWALMDFTFFDGFKYFMIFDVNNGEFDRHLTKPVSPIFLLAFTKPRLEASIYFLALLIFFIYKASLVAAQITFFSTILFIASVLMALYIYFMVFACYASLTFFMTKSGQTIRTLQSISDQTFYPPSIFPKEIQFLFISAVPSAFAGYVPVMALLNKTTTFMLITAIAIASATTILVKITWSIGLKRYSSASS